MWEMANLCRKWFKYLTIGLINCEMTQRFGNWQKYLGNGLDIWCAVFHERHKYVAINLNILNMASMCGKRLKYHRNGFTMLEMT